MVQTEFGGPVTYIRQKGYFDWADLLKSIRGWLKDEFYNVEETKHKHKPNEQEVEMSGFRKLNEYVKYYFDIKIRTENVAIVELIKDGSYGKIEPATAKVLDDMDINNEHLVKLVDKLLDITRIEQGRTKYAFAEVDIRSLINEATNDLKIKARDKKIKIDWIAPKKPKNIFCDQEKIHHVVYNFIDNALKYSDGGVVKVALEEDVDGVAVRVKDRGIGFDKNDEGNFYHKFYRGDNVRTIAVSGTGLGLYVCRKFIEAHNGRVWARSAGLGMGSEFGFWIPAKQKAPSAA